MIRVSHLAAAAALTVLAAASASAEPSVRILPLPFEVTEFRGPRSRLAAVVASIDGMRDTKALAGRVPVVVWGPAGGAALTLEGGEIGITRLRGKPGDLVTAERSRDAIPSSRIAVVGPLTVALTEPSRDYPHEALGTSTHAKSLTVTERQPVRPSTEPKAVPTETTRIEAGAGAVFEDREPRIVDLAQGGPPSIVTIRSDRERGSAMVVIGKRDGIWRIVAETPPVGEPARWLNPAGAADFLGAGSAQVALVRTPHLDGVLQLWAIGSEGAKLVAEKAGYSNHAFGRTAQDLADAVDVDGDGRPELAVPTLDRRAVAVLSFRTGGATELWRVALPAAAATGLTALGQGRDIHILVGLEDGRVAEVRP